MNEAQLLLDDLVTSNGELVERAEVDGQLLNDTVASLEAITNEMFETGLVTRDVAVNLIPLVPSMEDVMPNSFSAYPSEQGLKVAVEGFFDSIGEIIVGGMKLIIKLIFGALKLLGKPFVWLFGDGSDSGAVASTGSNVSEAQEAAKEAGIEKVEEAAKESDSKFNQLEGLLSESMGDMLKATTGGLDATFKLIKDQMAGVAAATTIGKKDVALLEGLEATWNGLEKDLSKEMTADAKTVAQKLASGLNLKTKVGSTADELVVTLEGMVAELKELRGKEIDDAAKVSAVKAVVEKVNPKTFESIDKAGKDASKTLESVIEKGENGTDKLPTIDSEALGSDPKAKEAYDRLKVAEGRYRAGLITANKINARIAEVTVILSNSALQVSKKTKVISLSAKKK